ncbi:sel1 repeat family protein [Paraburkholderia sp. USG1]|uniref:tetratricopeptide repeat protein n=1 Tax=Paraburkholderia sp. USG1 TaxID=2952268 RepID=UPI00285C9110|nr:tetratricopeptide repeat protein [Paraburkholderia sp. USG1]MDR8398345.1 sel1 repeat family protein [Paraburkholderia sp. USG1]
MLARQISGGQKARGTVRRAYQAVMRLRSLPGRLLFPSAASETRPQRPPHTPLVIRIQRRRVPVEHLQSLLASNPGYATRWIEAAAKTGLVAAQIVWGQLLLEGRGALRRDARAAFASFEAASTSGDAEALNMTGRCYEQGWGVEADPQRAIACFEAAAQAGHTWGQVNLAQMLMRAGHPADRPRCFALFRAAAEGGTLKPNLKAMNSLARFLEEGWAGPPDPAGAAHWYQKAAALGDHWAQFNLATILFRQGDHDAAHRWLGNAIAISDNGFRRRIAPLLLARPEGLLRERGLDALARCAAHGAPEDLYAYAQALDTGVAGSTDPVAADIFFSAAAAKGHPQAVARQGRVMQARRWPRLAALGRAIAGALPQKIQ